MVKKPRLISEAIRLKNLIVLRCIKKFNNSYKPTNIKNCTVNAAQEETRKEIRTDNNKNNPILYLIVFLSQLNSIQILSIIGNKQKKIPDNPCWILHRKK